MKYKTYYKNIRLLLLGTMAIATIISVYSCNSDKPTNIEPNIVTLAATNITRNEATLNGTVTVKGETTMPKLRFRYGITEAMPITTPKVENETSPFSFHLTGLTAGTTYYYMLEGCNEQTTVNSNIMTFNTLSNDKPSLRATSIIGHGPMSVIIGYDITDDGGELITATGCIYVLASTKDTCRVELKNYHGGNGKQTLLLSNLERNSTYEIWPYAKSRVGESIGNHISFTTSDALLLGEAGQLRSLMGSGIYDYTEISISGPMNGDDLYCLRAMMGRGSDNTTTSGKLSSVNMTDAQIVEGGIPYDDSRYTKNNVVGQGLFADCTQLRIINLPNNTTTIEKDAFARCNSLEQIEMPISVSSILPSSGCTALKSIRVSNANNYYKSIDDVLLTADGTKIVWFPMGKTGTYSLPSTITSIGNYAFKECSIENFSLPDNIKEMGMGAFMDSKIKEVKLSDNLRLVPTATFQGCTLLHTVRLGSKTELISDYAFSECPLTDIYVDATLPPVCTALSFTQGNASLFNTCRVHVPKGRTNIYKASEGWKLFKNIITD